MFHVKHFLNDTITAIATPIGIGGIGIIRLSGEKAKAIFLSLFESPQKNSFKSHQMLHGWIVDPESKQRIDESLACFMQAPHSYTGEDTVELYCHGGATILQRTLELTLGQGARLANKGEFTKRAYLNGKLDLSQAEAVLDLIGAKTYVGAGFAMEQLEGKLSGTTQGLREKLLNFQALLEAEIDFPEDVAEVKTQDKKATLTGINDEIQHLLKVGERAKIFREGITVAIVGKPNTGKSSLLNALLGEERAIVTEVAGTTRDTIEETVNLEGIAVKLIDTAGLRPTQGRVEAEGIKRTEKELTSAALLIVVLDASAPLEQMDREVLLKTRSRKGVVALNKQDKGLIITPEEVSQISPKFSCYPVSALQGEGVHRLAKGIRDLIQLQAPREQSPILINLRHRQCLEKARELVSQAFSSLDNGQPVEIVAVDVKGAIIALGEITGEQVSEEVINAIFEQFCVGK